MQATRTASLPPKLTASLRFSAEFFDLQRCRTKGEDAIPRVIEFQDGQMIVTPFRPWASYHEPLKTSLNERACFSSSASGRRWSSGSCARQTRPTYAPERPHHPPGKGLPHGFPALPSASTSFFTSSPSTGRSAMGGGRLSMMLSSGTPRSTDLSRRKKSCGLLRSFTRL